MKGIFAVYKPKGPTSYDIIRQIKNITGVERVGHAGTLDPLAAGILVVGVGREATKKLGEIVAKEKEYIAKIKLGVASSTDDEEGKKTIYNIRKKPVLLLIKKATQQFIGKIKQTPPAYSALKFEGRAAYKYARAGKKIKLEPRLVEIKEIEILNYKWPFLELRVVTGPGVYIRALARDLGEDLNVGGYLAELERIRVGQFNKSNAVDIKELNQGEKIR